ncbi:MAG: c-type cytochrome [Hydrogenophaga sp.]|uniref:c-type cytochrome n=1 Tax=Hydrogenophaga sp. TaxID=1904254 RepID=UPI001DEFC452|nr:cytochrome c [Hydrogenophaga sp.]MBX3608297.1 c-type cytochrome [Hydrogenophaga sp.]
MTRRVLWGLAVVLLLAMGVFAVRVWMTLRPAPLDAGPEPVATPALVERGRLLASAGNCMACHTARAGAPWAGGHAVQTRFGAIVSSNLTPHTSGLGDWTAAQFHRALHQGQSHDGRLLYPAFPYLHTTRLPRSDTDALFVYLRTLPPVDRPREPHHLRFPYDQPLALAAWRALFFQPAEPVPEPSAADPVAQGAWWVQGVAHCAACHRAPGPLESPGQALGGGLMPDGHWWAPSLRDPKEAGVQDWSVDDVLALLRDGRNGHASAAGPMAEVVRDGTQHLPEAQLLAMASYLRALPRETTPREDKPAEPSVLQAGALLYKDRCAQCHGSNGEGTWAEGASLNGPWAWPPLAGNRVVTQAAPVNLVRWVLDGGFGASTSAHPQPWGMPPFRSLLSDAEVAAVASYVRQAWGNQAGGVSALEVQRLR